MPGIHQHAAGPRANVAEGSLADHCRVYHSDSARNEVLGWHVHLLMPWGPVEPGHSPTDGHELGDPIGDGRVLLTECHLGPTLVFETRLASLCVSTPISGEQRVASLGAEPDARTASRGSTFCSTLLRVAPLCCVTGVALC